MPQVNGHGKGRAGWRAMVAMTALLAALWTVSIVSRDAMGAEGDGCTPACVMLIQVDGLEPKDITLETTPYLWLLSHPNVQGQNLPFIALNGRSGWIWQAPRGVVSTGTASATASLLSGGYPEKSGVPASDFYGASDGGSIARQRLTAGGFGDLAGPEAGADVAEPVAASGGLGVDTLIGAVRNTGGDAAVFLGDPGLAGIAEATSLGSPHWFPPGGEDQATVPEQQYTGDPRLCPIPRYPDGGTQFPNQPAEDNYHPDHCPANDFTTMHKAFSDLALPGSAGVGFTFIHLAELGAAKRLATDVADVDPNDPESGVPDSGIGHPPQVPEALSDMDQAIGTFVERYANEKSEKWQKTVLMVVGANGYQRTPLVNRVPHPEFVADVTQDVSDYVADYNKGGAQRGSLTLVPQGTMATVYYGLGGKGEPEDKAGALEALRADLKTDVNEACATRNPAMAPCVENVYYVDKDTPGLENPQAETVAGAHPTWHLDARHPDTGARTGASGDLVITLKRGWAFGRIVGLPYQAGLEGKPTSNANLASTGGPQERAVAALINGPGSGGPYAVRNLDSLGSSQVGAGGVKYYPVSNQPVDPSDPDNPPGIDNQACPDTVTDPGGLSCANDPFFVGDDTESVGDNPESVGHEAQPDTVDFAITISALMQLPFESHPDQLQGRVLQEAFTNKLFTPCVGDECDPPPPPEPQPEPPPIPPPPPPVVEQEEGFKFHGLLQKAEASVVATRGTRDLTYRRAPRGTKFSSIKLEADFGKPETAVTLTFYRPAASASGATARGSKVVRLKAIGRFDPFVVKRGHVTMRLKIPELFRPTHVGINVREVLLRNGKRVRKGGEPCTTQKTRAPVKFRCVGPTRGTILKVADSIHLHKRKGGAAPKRRKRR